MYNPSATIHPRIAYMFDEKMDDGKALSGRVRATNGWSVVGQINAGGACATGSNQNEYAKGSTASEDAVSACAFSISLFRQ